MTNVEYTRFFLIFNRLDTTQIVFDEIRKAQPAQLFDAADGQHKNRSTDYKLCKKNPGYHSAGRLGLQCIHPFSG